MNYPYYSQPMQDQLAQLRQPYQQQYQQQYHQPSGGINWVQGLEAAKAYMVAPGNSVLLMDSDASTFYLKTADYSGMPQPLRIFDYTERTDKTKTDDFVSRAEFNALAARIDALGNTPRKPEKNEEDIYYESDLQHSER